MLKHIPRDISWPSRGSSLLVKPFRGLIVRDQLLLFRLNSQKVVGAQCHASHDSSSMRGGFEVNSNQGSELPHACCIFLCLVRVLPHQVYLINIAANSGSTRCSKCATCAASVTGFTYLSGKVLNHPNPFSARKDCVNTIMNNHDRTYSWDWIESVYSHYPWVSVLCGMLPCPTSLHANP